MCIQVLGIRVCMRTEGAACNLAFMLAIVVGRDVLRVGLMHLDAGAREPGPGHLPVAVQIGLDQAEREEANEALSPHLVELRRGRLLATLRARHEVATAHEEAVVPRLVPQEAQRDQHEHVLPRRSRSVQVEELAKQFQGNDGAREEAEYVQHLQPRAASTAGSGLSGPQRR